MIKGAVFDIDGTLIDSVDLHASTWDEAFTKFGYSVSFEQARSQIGEGGDQLIPILLAATQQHSNTATQQHSNTATRQHGNTATSSWRST
jgi:beta-phosphoglucomutase-like phosphatase (HAD superfamily)